MNPSWRVSKIEMVDPYGWHNLDAKTLLYIKDKLANFESMTGVRKIQSFSKCQRFMHRSSNTFT